MRVETLKEVRERESTVAISTAPVTIIIQHLLEQTPQIVLRKDFLR